MENTLGFQLWKSITNWAYMVADSTIPILLNLLGMQMIGPLPMAHQCFAFILIFGLFFPRDDGLMDMSVAFYLGYMEWPHHHTINFGLKLLKFDVVEIYVDLSTWWRWACFRLVSGSHVSGSLSSSSHLIWFKWNHLNRLLESKCKVGTLPQNVTKNETRWG